MTDVQQTDPARIFQAVSALSPERTSMRYGINYSTFRRYVGQGRPTAIAQYYGLVEPGLSQATHLFRGVRRGLLADGDMGADKKVLVYCWRPNFDFRWIGDPWTGKIWTGTAPEQRLFTVLVTGYSDTMTDKVNGMIVHWNWVRQARNKPGYPTGYETRYDETLWS